jgi:hypothetical protein
MDSRGQCPAEKETSAGRHPHEILARSFAYALRAVKLYQYLQRRKDGAGWILGKQYLRAATSIGPTSKRLNRVKVALTSFISWALLRKKRGKAAIGFIS